MLTLQEHLQKLRSLRNFNVDFYLQEKIKMINQFFSENELDSAVVGLSGGVDSAVTILLLKKASEQENSPIKKLIGVIAPVGGIGTSGQRSAVVRAKLLVDTHNLDFNCVDLYSAYNEIVYQTKIDQNYTNDAWSEGQMASVLRTPVFYYQAAILQSQGFRSLVVGTTNRDEGSYIGFFGKASDAMVDLQIISDIHKSEVYQLANVLGVNQEIINEKPRGDVWDNKVDEEMIGAPYWFLEMYLLMKEYKPKIDVNGDEAKTFIEYAKNIENLHIKNSHKYKVGNPAHFLDVMNRKIEKGW